MLGSKFGRVTKQVASYATATAARAEAASASDIQVEKLTNGVTVASLQRNWPTARVSLIFQAGSRNEDASTRGMTHLIRRSAGLSSTENTSFGITRSIMQMGAGLQCSATRDHLIYSIDIGSDIVGDGVELLANVATGPLFYHWELRDNVYDMMKRDVDFLHRHDHTTLLFEKLHEAAFKTTLGRSLYAPAHKIGDISYEQIQEYLARHVVPERATVVGVGVSQAQMRVIGNMLNFDHITSGQQVKKPVDEPARFRGGECRVDVASPIAQVGLVSESVGLNKGPEGLSFAVLAHALGHGAPNVQWGSGASPLSRAVAGACQEPAFASSVNLSYSDGGAFGFYVSANASEIGAAVKAARGTVVAAAKTGVKPEDVQSAKNQLKTNLLIKAESAAEAANDVGLQAANGEKVLSVAELAAQVDSVTADQVNQAAKKLLTAKAAMASVGDIEGVPYINDFA